jgi:UDP-N-acetylmuramyl pentapeptide phosphotransferase/UDP-N-acetylglucosamine-1-phosphate transferase
MSDLQGGLNERAGIFFESKLRKRGFGIRMSDSDALSALLELGCIVFAAAILCAGLIVLLRPLLKRYALARPNARSSHTIPTPQGGGIAVVLATLFVTAAVLFLHFGLSRVLVTFGVLSAATIGLAIVGVLDDINPLGTLPRLAVQTIVVVVLIALLPANAQVLPVLPWWLERAALVFAGVWFVNLVNFMDGIDWMTVAEVIPLTASLVLLAFFGALPVPATLLALALLGAIIGFAPFNRPIAKLFLGDVGSLPIGLLLYWLLLQLAVRGQLVAALLLPLYYVADTTIVLLRRAINGEPITQAHRTHFYQLAIERGFSVLEVVSRVFAANLALAALAIATVARPYLTIDFAALALGGALVAWLLAIFASGEER